MGASPDQISSFSIGNHLPNGVANRRDLNIIMQTGAILLMMILLYVLWEFSVKDNTDILIKDALTMAESDLSESFNTGIWNIFNMLQVKAD